jgi:arylsulfatase
MMNQYKIMIKALFAAVLFLISGRVSYGQQSREKPNVIIILTDDQGYGDFSCNGNPVLQTPALDRLYNESIRFSDFHTSPLCTPSRGELMSGLDALHNKAGTVGTGRDILRRDIITMPEAFAQNGYETGIFGKWHLGDNYPDRPMDRGFKKCIWFKGWGLLSEAEYDNDYYKTRYLDSLETKYSGKYCTNLWFDKAMEWMDEMIDRKKPFFTYIATNAPHGPFNAPRADFRFYKNKVSDVKTARFLGMIRNIDRNMQHLEKWLEEKHIKNNTIVIFMNDNGGTGGVDLYNAGMRGEKGSNYDGGHRGACFMSWPDGPLGSPRTVSYTSELQDLLPTLADMLNFKLKGKPHFDGESLKTVLTQDKKAKDRMFVVQYGGHAHPEKYFSCVVWNNWRLVGANELYDIGKDPHQDHNVADSYPDVLKKMQGFYESWWRKTSVGINKFVPLVIGADKENPAILTSDFWTDSEYVNTQWKVAQAGGPVNGGTWHVHVEKSGKYRLELSRWPFHLKRDLTAAGPDTAVGGTRIRSGKAVSIVYGCLSIDGNTPVIIKKNNAEATAIPMEMNLRAGDHTLRAWFKDENKKDRCGAYYVKATYIY